MNTSGSAMSRLAPQFNKPYIAQALGKPGQNGIGFQLTLKRVIGTTTGSTRGFDFVSGCSTFAICAGSAVIVGHLDETLNVTQRFFRARPSVLPINIALPFYNSAILPSTPDSRSRLTSTLRDNMTGSKSMGSPSGDYSDISGKGIARQRARAATCVALSRDGKLLAVGEVWIMNIIWLFAELCRQDTTQG